MLRVMRSVLEKPLLETDEANVIEFYSRSGELTALLFHEFDNDMWMLSTKLDTDWEATLVRTGYTVNNRSAKEFIGTIK